MLVNILFTIIMIFGFTALYVELGFARLTQTQMQNAADTAALEGLRQRDMVSCDPLDTVCLIARDLARRQAAAKMVGWMFDDDFDTTNGDSLTLGAGPVVNFTDVGQGPSLASQHYDSSTSSIYKPSSELNGTNLCHGDMLSGLYAVGPPAEDAFYTRADFSRPGSADCSAAADEAQSAQANSFLVRLRRTDHRNDALNRTPNVSSSGEPIPFLFGRGTPMQADPNSTYVPFRDGITVRSTSIADARPALRVGKPVPGTPAIPGVSNFGITRLLWQSLPEGHAVRLTIGAGGELTPTAGVPGAGQLAQPALIVATNLVPSAVATNLPGPGFVPIYDQSISVGKSLVIGYGFAQIDNVTAASLDITKTAFVIASANASALLAGALPPIPPTELDQVLSANRSLKTSNDGALLAPVLVR